MKKTPDDKILDRIVETQALLNRYEPASVENLTEALQGVVDAIARKLPKATGTNRQKLQTLYKQARFELNKLKTPFINDLSGDMENTGKIAYDATAKGFSEGLDLQALTFDQLPTSAIAMWTDLSTDISMWAYDEKRIFKPMKEITKAFAGHEKAFRAAITQSLAEGLGTKATQRRFKELTLSKISNAGIRAIARTAIAESMTRARNYSYDNNFSDVITGYQWISTLDSRTTIICASQAGLIHKKRSDFLYGDPPLHFGCRSIIVPITDFSDKENIRVRTRTWDEVQSIDGDKQKYTKFVLASDEVKNIKLPDQRTKFNAFDVWFKQLPQDRQVQWLGPQKYKIYQTGNLGMKQLVDGAGKIRTVEELAKLAGIDAEQLKEIRRNTIPAYQPRVTKFRAAAERRGEI